MAATNQGGSGRKLYYNVSYGKLQTRTKEVPEGYTEIEETDLKAQTQKVQNIDLRNKYMEKTGDYPYGVFYDKIEGSIQTIEKNVYDKGTSLQFEILDNEGDNCILQCKFYSKYTENVLNRLCNTKDIKDSFSFVPYAIPNEFTTDDGKDIKMYNQGISLREKGQKVDSKYTSKEPGDMPPTERVENSDGEEVTSRVKRINFLFDEVVKKFEATVSKDTAKPNTATSDKNTEETNVVEDDDDDLPF